MLIYLCKRVKLQPLKYAAQSSLSLQPWNKKHIKLKLLYVISKKWKSYTEITVYCAKQCEGNAQFSILFISTSYLFVTHLLPKFYSLAGHVNSDKIVINLAKQVAK